MATTPMLEQYRRIKAEHRDAFLLFRLGDFYELFDDDAHQASRLLGLTLTHRQSQPMCGVPYHAAHSYIGRLLKAGKKVAICEQISLPANGKGLAERKVVEVLSPGTVVDEDYLEPDRSNYLLAVGTVLGRIAFGWIEASTGEFNLAAGRDFSVETIQRELARLQPREVLVQESVLEELRGLDELLRERDGVVVNRYPDWVFDPNQGDRLLRRHLNVQNLKGFGFDDGDPALTTAPVLIEYLEDNAQNVLRHVHSVRRVGDAEFVVLDEATQRNLEVVQNLRDSGRHFTLLEVLNHTRTAMGARLLRNWLLAPLREPEQIEYRLSRVDQLYSDQAVLARIRRLLQECFDVERLIGRLGLEKAHPKDLRALGESLDIAEKLKEALPGWWVDEVLSREDAWSRLGSIRSKIESQIVDDPPTTTNEGGIFRDGVDPSLDSLRHTDRHSRGILQNYLEEQRTQTGIGSLKIRYNRVLGHFFEIPKSQVSRIPAEFIPRQSLSNVERYTSNELSRLESEINTASQQAAIREESMFQELRHSIIAEIPLLSAVAQRVATIDATQSLAWAATQNGYVRPVISAERDLAVREGRHPVVEAHLPAGDFVPNDIELTGAAGRFALITGPNMAGKSTILRQTALVTLMAQIGSYVPAAEASVGVVDRIFCRVGASDNIARGESTFLLEMNETSNILRNATDRSLIIMDEVGRGTSTHDGLAIAWAVIEYILDVVKARTLFATHYHELTGIDRPGFDNYSMSVAHDRGEIVFLRRLIRGAADRSYGVDVAAMAGVPPVVVERARDLLAFFEDSGAPQVKQPSGDSSDSGRPPAPATGQSELFTPAELISAELRALDPDQVSPRDALDLIYRWKKSLA